MSKDKKHEKNGAQHTEAGEAISGYEILIDMLAKGKKEQESLTKLITQDGPPHKQWQHTLVLSRLAELITFAEEATDTVFEPLPGDAVAAEGPDGGKGQLLPVHFPAQSLEVLDEDSSFVKKLSKGPAHEAAYTAVLLQAVEWLINTLFEEEGEEEDQEEDDTES